LSRIQDDKRELQIANLFRLIPGTSRIGVDASDEEANKFELKSTTRDQVSTARDLGPKHIERWEQRYWIIGRGISIGETFDFNSFYFLSRCHMQGWYDMLTARFDADLALRNRLLDVANPFFADHDLKRVGRLMYDGMLLNDPGLPWRYVKQNGIEIAYDHAYTLRQLIVQFPLDTPLFQPVHSSVIQFVKGEYEPTISQSTAPR